MKAAIRARAARGPAGADPATAYAPAVSGADAAASTFTRALSAERLPATAPTVTTSSTAPTIAGVAAVAHAPADGSNSTALLTAVRTGEYTFVGGRMMKAGAAFPLYSGVRRIPKPASPQGFGDTVAETVTDAPTWSIQQILAEGGLLRVLVELVPGAGLTEVYSCGPTVRTGTAQAGATGTITLDTGALATNGAYTGRWVRITSGTGVGQSRQISGYTGSTKVAAVSPAWSTAPDATSVFEVALGRRDSNTASGNAYALLDFGYRRMRRVRIECWGTTFLGINTSTLDTVAPGTPTGAVTDVAVGDSFCAGTGADGGLSVAYHAAAYNGFELANISVGGTGWLNTGTNSLNFADRLLPPLNSWWVGGGRGASAGTFTLTQGAATTTAIAYNATIATIQAAADTAFGAGAFTVAGDNAQNFYLVGRGAAAASSTAMSGTFSFTGGLPFVTRWDGDLAPVVPVDAAGKAKPFHITLAGGHNDTTSTNAGYTPAVLQAQVESVVGRLAARYPSAVLWVVGNMFLPQGSAGGDVTAANTAIAAACANVLPRVNGRLPYIDPMAGTWWSGTGKLTAPAGTGTSDVCCDTDGVHPTPPGHLVGGVRLGQARALVLSAA